MKHVYLPTYGTHEEGPFEYLGLVNDSDYASVGSDYVPVPKAYILYLDKKGFVCRHSIKDRCRIVNISKLEQALK